MLPAKLLAVIILIPFSGCLASEEVSAPFQHGWARYELDNGKTLKVQIFPETVSFMGPDSKMAQGIPVSIDYESINGVPVTHQYIMAEPGLRIREIQPCAGTCEYTAIYWFAEPMAMPLGIGLPHVAHEIRNEMGLRVNEGNFTIPEGEEVRRFSPISFPYGSFTFLENSVFPDRFYISIEKYELIGNLVDFELRGPVSFPPQRTWDTIGSPQNDPFFPNSGEEFVVPGLIPLQIIEVVREEYGGSGCFSKFGISDPQEARTLIFDEPYVRGSVMFIEENRRLEIFTYSFSQNSGEITVSYDGSLESKSGILCGKTVGGTYHQLAFFGRQLPISIVDGFSSVSVSTLESAKQSPSISFALRPKYTEGKSIVSFQPYSMDFDESTGNILAMLVAPGDIEALDEYAINGGPTPDDFVGMRLYEGQGQEGLLRPFPENLFQ